MYAPEVMHFIDALTSHSGLTGTDVSSGEALRMLDELYKLLAPVLPMGSDSNKRIWIWADRGCADDNWDYEEWRISGECDTRKDFEELFHELYPYDRYWFPLEIMEYHGFRGVLLRYRCILQHDSGNPSPLYRKRYLESMDEDMLTFLLEAAERSMHLIKDGTYRAFIEENLPLINRSGAIPSKIFHEVYPEAKRNLLKGLKADEIKAFESIVSSGLYTEDTVGRIPEMTSGLYFSAVEASYSELGGKYDKDIPIKERYKRMTFSYGESLVALNDSDPAAFEKWYHEWHDGHLWEIVPGGSFSSVSLSVHRDDYGWYFSVNGVASLMEIVRIFLAVYRMGLPVCLYKPERILDSLYERDRIYITPDGIPPHGDSTVNGEYMLHSINLSPEDIQNGKLIKNIDWYPLEFPKFKKEES